MARVMFTWTFNALTAGNGVEPGSRRKSAIRREGCGNGTEKSPIDEWRVIRKLRPPDLRVDHLPAQVQLWEVLAGIMLDYPSLDDSRSGDMMCLFEVRRGGRMAKLSRIAPEIPVSDLKIAIDYYCQKLGFELAVKFIEGGYAIVERDGIAIHLFENDESHSAVGVHLFTHELDELQAELRSRGASICQDITHKPWGNRDFRVNDCAGNILKFTEPDAVS